jgi:hypothetical protein
MFSSVYIFSAVASQIDEAVGKEKAANKDDNEEGAKSGKCFDTFEPQL